MSDLYRKYGYFQCSKCREKWESSNVFCDKKTRQVAYGQECKTCHIMCKPYRLENLRCPVCKEFNCTCENKRHVDEKKPHRRDLCEKCQKGRPCKDARTH